MRKNNKYSFETKLEAIRMKDKGYSQREILTALGIKSPTQLKTWWNKYLEGGEELLLADNRGKHNKPRKGRTKTKFASIEEENAYLKAEVEWLKKSIIQKWGKLP